MNRWKLQRAWVPFMLGTLLTSCGGSNGLETVPGKFRFIGKLVAQSVSVGATHVIGVSAEAGSPETVLAALDPDGRFVLDLPLGRSYVIGVIDSSRIGSAMVRGYLEFSGMHAVPVMEEGAFDLGAVSQTDGSRWASELASIGGLLTKLSVGAATIDALAAQDGLALRLLNPDVDNDGKLDATQTGKAFVSEVSAYFQAQISAAPVTIDMLLGTAPAAIDAFPFDSSMAAPTTATFGYFTQSTTETTLNFRFVDVEGVVVSILPQGAAALNNDTDGAFTASTWSQNPAYQVVEMPLLPASELPRGEIRVSFDLSGTALTFFPMLAQPVADLAQGYQHAFASIYLTENTGSGSCTVAPCVFTSLGYKWKIMTSAGVRDATVADMEALVSSRGAKYEFTTTSSAAIEIPIPSNAIEGTIPWVADNATLGSVSGSTFVALTRAGLCKSKVTHLDRFGMRYQYRIGQSTDATGCPP